MPAKKDLFDQFLSMTVTMSGIDTITFGQVAIGMSIFDYAALIISRIEYVVGRTTWAELSVNTDEFQMAITGSNTIGDLGSNRPEVYDYMIIDAHQVGTPGNYMVFPQPLIHDFSTMKGGGLLVPAQDLYLGLDSLGFAAAGSGLARVYFTVKALGAADFIELVQRLRVLST